MTGAQQSKLVMIPHLHHQDATGERVETGRESEGRGDAVEPTVASHPVAGEPMDLIGQYEKEGITPAKATSERFMVGASFCNTRFNAASFAFLNLDGTGFAPLAPNALALEDRWILSRLQNACVTIDKNLNGYNPSAAIATARDFFWNELCDWYLEMIKPRMREDADPASKSSAQQVLSAVLDQTLRLLHPFIPFLTSVKMFTYVVV
mgnify:CR=1 FL=1